MVEPSGRRGSVVAFHSTCHTLYLALSRTHAAKVGLSANRAAEVPAGEMSRDVWDKPSSSHLQGRLKWHHYGEVASSDVCISWGFCRLVLTDGTRHQGEMRRDGAAHSTQLSGATWAHKGFSRPNQCNSPEEVVIGCCVFPTLVSEFLIPNRM